MECRPRYNCRLRLDRHAEAAKASQRSPDAHCCLGSPHLGKGMCALGGLLHGRQVVGTLGGGFCRRCAALAEDIAAGEGLGSPPLEALKDHSAPFSPEQTRCGPGAPQVEDWGMRNQSHSAANLEQLWRDWENVHCPGIDMEWRALTLISKGQC